MPRFFGDKMFYLIGYDVNTTTGAGQRRLNKVAKICCNFGQRVQNSLFECDLNGAQYVDLKAQLLNTIDKETDSLRIYSLGNKYSDKIEHYGTKETYDPRGDLIF